MKLSIKQTQALDYLEDNSTIELLFGGAAGGGKSALGCYWQIKRRLMFPGSRGLIGRSKFKTLKDTTLKTFFEIAAIQGLKKDYHFWLTGSHDKENPNCIMFRNGSLIYLKDLFLYPSDPDFDALGGFEITDAFIDEAAQVVEKAKDVVKSRIRYKLDEFGLIPKILMSCNPSKNWTYSQFYKPDKENKLPPFRKFIQSLAKDNPYLSKAYIDNLLTLGKDLVQRLFYGNWEYTDDPLLLFPNYDRILEMFTNSFIETDQINKSELLDKPTTKYITADIAYEGSDKFVIGVWRGFVCEKIIVIDKIDETLVAAKIEEVRLKYNIPLSNIAYDADGLKKYVKQSAKTGYLKGARQFHNNAKPIGKENYFNLKAQCYFMLAEMVNQGLLFVKDQTYRDIMIAEFEQIKQRERSDNSEKLKIERKQDLKERLGHSPDFVDMMAMRMLFELSVVVTHQTDEEILKQINY